MSRPQTPLSRGSSSTPAPVMETDLYRPLANAIQRNLPPADPSTSLASLLNLDGQTYNARLSGKTVLLTDVPLAGSSGTQFSRRRKRADDDKGKDKETLGGSVRRGAAITGRATRVEYAALLPLHYMHNAYVAQTLGLPPLPSPSSSSAAAASSSAATSAAGAKFLPGVSAEFMQSKLLKCDFTGAILRVSAAKNPSLVGQNGMVLEETANSFRLACADDRVRVVPKVGTQFTLSFPAYSPIPTLRSGGTGEPGGEVDWAAWEATTPRVELDILGSSIAFRSADRAGRKFRPAQGSNGSGWAEDFVRGEWSFLGDLGSAGYEGTRRNGNGNVLPGRRKRGKSRRKDPVAGGTVQVF